MVSKTLSLDFFSVSIFDPLSLRIIQFSIKFYFIHILVPELERERRKLLRKKKMREQEVVYFSFIIEMPKYSVKVSFLTR